MLKKNKELDFSFVDNLSTTLLGVYFANKVLFDTSDSFIFLWIIFATILILGFLIVNSDNWKTRVSIISFLIILFVILPLIPLELVFIRYLLEDKTLYFGFIGWAALREIIRQFPDNWQ